MAPATVLEVSVSHGDSAISHPRDQDYLSLNEGKDCEVDLQQALAYMVANLRKREREEKAKAWSKNYDQEMILEQPTSSITPNTVFTSRTPSERDHHGYTIC